MLTYIKRVLFINIAIMKIHNSMCPGLGFGGGKKGGGDMDMDKK